MKNQTLIFAVALALASAAAFAGEPAPTASPAKTTESGKKEAPPSVPMISIVGSEKDVARIAGSAHVVDEEKLEERDYNDIHRILTEVPGVYVREEDGYGLRPNIGIRGAASDRSAKVTLMEDGVLFGPAPYSAPAAYYFPLSTRMVAVEVFKGPASIQYGPHTIGGAVNLVTRPVPVSPEAMLDVSFGERDTWKLHGYAGTRYGNSGILLEGVRLETDGFKDLDGGGDTGFTRNEVMLKADHRWSIADVDLLTEVKAGYSDEESNETYLGISDDDFDDTPFRRYAGSQRDRMKWDRWQVHLSQLVTVTPDLTFQLTGYRHDLDRAWRKLNRFEEGAPPLHDIFADTTGRNAVFISILRGDLDSTTPLETLLVGTNDRSFLSQGLQLTGDWFLATGPLNHSVDFGIRLHDDEIVRDHTEDPYRMTNGTLVRSADPTRQVAANTGEALATALYLRDEIEWRFLTVTPGLRFESIANDYQDRIPTLSGEPAEDDSDTQNVWIPGIGLLATVYGDLNFIAGVHRGFSPVAPGQSGSADPEDSINYEAGLRYFTTVARAEVIGFFNDYDNILATCTQGGGCDPEDVDKQFNGGAAEIYGFELLADIEQNVGWDIVVPASLSYTFTQTKFRTDFDSASAIFGEVKYGDEIPYIPEHQLSFSLGLERGPFGASTALTYVGEMRDVAGQGDIPDNELVEDHFVADLFAHWDFNESGRLYLGIDNVGDADYIVSRRPFGARPGKPFQVQGGIKYRFGG